MNLKTKFNNGDVVYHIQQISESDVCNVIGPMTIGQVRVKITDSPGVDGEETFNNYMAQQGTKEQYMCIETGIGTGNVYSVENLFGTEDAAKTEADKRNNTSLCEG